MTNANYKEVMRQRLIEAEGKATLTRPIAWLNKGAANYASLSEMTADKQELLDLVNAKMTKTLSEVDLAEINVDAALWHMASILICAGVCMVDEEACVLLTLHPHKQRSNPVIVTGFGQEFTLYKFGLKDAGGLRFMQRWLPLIQLIASFGLLHQVRSEGVGNRAFTICEKSQVPYFVLPSTNSSLSVSEKKTLAEHVTHSNLFPVVGSVDEPLTDSLGRMTMLGYYLNPPTLFVIPAEDSRVSLDELISSHPVVIECGRVTLKCLMLTFCESAVLNQVRQQFPSLLSVTHVEESGFWNFQWTHIPDDEELYNDSSIGSAVFQSLTSITASETTIDRTQTGVISSVSLPEVCIAIIASFLNGTAHEASSQVNDLLTSTAAESREAGPPAALALAAAAAPAPASSPSDPSSSCQAIVLWTEPRIVSYRQVLKIHYASLSMSPIVLPSIPWNEPLLVEIVPAKEKKKKKASVFRRLKTKLSSFFRCGGASAVTD